MQTTGEKMKMRDEFVESKLEFNESGRDEGNDDRESKERNTQLDEIEGEIRKLGKRLDEIQREEDEQTDKYSDRFLDLQGERATINKTLVDLDYEHKVLCARLIRENRVKENEER
jgi:hypothetical protein